MKKNRWILLALVVVTICSFAVAHKAIQPLQPSQAPTLSAAALDKLAAVPSLDQTILRMAATKLRGERKPMATVDLQITVKLKPLPGGCVEECVYSGSVVIACTAPICNFPD